MHVKEQAAGKHGLFVAMYPRTLRIYFRTLNFLVCCKERRIMFKQTHEAVWATEGHGVLIPNHFVSHRAVGCTCPQS